MSTANLTQEQEVEMLGLTSTVSKATLNWARCSRQLVCAKTTQGHFKFGTQHKWDAKTLIHWKRVQMPRQRCSPSMALQHTAAREWINYI